MYSKEIEKAFKVFILIIIIFFFLLGVGITKGCSCIIKKYRIEIKNNDDNINEYQQNQTKKN